MTPVSGCTFHRDTSGFKAEKKLSKIEINQQMAEIKANSEGVKAMALEKTTAGSNRLQVIDAAQRTDECLKAFALT